MLSRLVADWHANGDPDGSVMIAHYRADVRELNGRARALMRAAGQLGTDELRRRRAAASPSATAFVVKRNDARSTSATATAASSRRVDLRAAERCSRPHRRPARRARRAFLAQPTHDGRPALEHGYALTAYAAQGLTCRHALVLARDDAYSEWVYTAMTRATDANRLYVIAERSRDRDEFAPAEPARDGRVLLAAALIRSRADELAIQHRIASRQSDRGIER